ncbi:MAG: hypothetical protein GXX86_00825 [Propionibacterium sp.]|nr:hypothetical protein [Propionibacterium sp.]
MKPRLEAVLIGIAIALTGCSLLGQDADRAVPAPASTPAEQPSPTASPEPDDPDPQVTLQPRPSDRPTPPPPPPREQPRRDPEPPPPPDQRLPEGAHPAAGGPVPADAVELTTVNSGFGVLLSPTGNIGCDLGFDYAGCGVASMRDNPKMGSDPDLGSHWWVTLHDVPVVGPKTDIALYMEPGAMEVPYGTSVYYAHYVCASESNGMTCWHTGTGHGAFLNRDVIATF